VLQEVATRLGSSVRSYDAVGCYGGEEFLVVVPNCKTDDIVTSGERLRRRVQDLPVAPTSGPISVTISVGVVSAAMGIGPMDYQTLLRLADEALYRAKSNGRNGVESARYAAAEALPPCPHLAREPVEKRQQYCYRAALDPNSSRQPC